MKPEINLAVATDDQNGIGKNGTLPWHFQKELKYFAKLTTGSAVIMGRSTWESLPTAYKPLPNRQNIVLTTQAAYSAPGAEIAHNLNQAIELAIAADRLLMPLRIFIIGGAQVFAQALETLPITTIYKTEIIANFHCDTFFPELPENFHKHIIRTESENGISFQFCRYTKVV